MNQLHTPFDTKDKVVYFLPSYLKEQEKKVGYWLVLDEIKQPKHETRHAEIE